MVTSTTYEVTIGDRTLVMALRREGDRVFARVGDGEEQEVDLATVRAPLRALALGEQRAQVLARRTEEGALVAVNGLQLQAEVVDAARARLARAAGGGQHRHARRELKSPMPGLVVKVLCQPGDSVEPGQPLIVLQAMKMENELSLPYGGTVKSVSADAGKTTEQGQVLVVLE